MTKYYQVLSHGAYYGKFFLAGEAGVTNVLDFNDVLTFEDFDKLVSEVHTMRYIPENICVLDVDTLSHLHTTLSYLSQATEDDLINLDMYTGLTIRYKGKVAKFCKLDYDKRKEIISSILEAIY